MTTTKTTSLERVQLSAIEQGWHIAQTGCTLTVNDPDNITGLDRFRRNVYGKKSVSGTEIRLDNGHGTNLWVRFLTNGSFHSAQRSASHHGAWPVSTVSDVLKEIERNRPAVLAERAERERQQQAEQQAARIAREARHNAISTLITTHQDEFDALVERFTAEAAR